MTYIIMDLEWNQARSSHDVVEDNDGNKLYGEVIQIGAVKLDDDLRISSEIKINVKPKFYKRIHRKVHQITGIEQKDLAKGEEFESAMKAFRVWCGEDFVFLTWGPDDIRVLRRNLALYDADSSWIDSWFNLQSIYNMQTDSGEGQKSLATAMEHFGITTDEPLHDALNDAHYTALVASKLDIEKGIAGLLQLERQKAILDESKPLVCEVYGGFRFRRDIFRDKEATGVTCPVCKNACTNVRKWVTERNDRYITLATCSEHGEFIARMTVTKINEINTVSKIIYEAGGGASTFYEKRAKKEAAKKTMRKKKVKNAAVRKKLSTVENPV
ncbi:MAG: exonuclease domain-containing protein [Oscillospiraceae bacterium]|nr:exonuclease domain-containing protein [Oscillospiraceae bacterium]